MEGLINIINFYSLFWESTQDVFFSRILALKDLKHVVESESFVTISTMNIASFDWEKRQVGFGRRSNLRVCTRNLPSTVTFSGLKDRKNIGSKYSDLTNRPGPPKGSFLEGKSLVSGKSRLVKCYNLARLGGSSAFSLTLISGKFMGLHLFEVILCISTSEIHHHSRRPCGN